MPKQKTIQFRKDIRVGLADIVSNSKEIARRIETTYPNMKRPFSRALSHKTGEYFFYIPKTEGFQAFYKDKDGVLYEISVFKR